MRKKVKMYTLSTCSHCKAAKKFLTEMGIMYEYTDVDLLQGQEKAAILQEVSEINPSISFPTILIGDKIIIGFRQGELADALGLLPSTE